MQYLQSKKKENYSKYEHFILSHTHCFVITFGNLAFVHCKRSTAELLNPDIMACKRWKFPKSLNSSAILINRTKSFTRSLIFWSGCAKQED